MRQCLLAAKLSLACKGSEKEVFTSLRMNASAKKRSRSPLCLFLYNERLKTYMFHCFVGEPPRAELLGRWGGLNVRLLDWLEEKIYHWICWTGTATGVNSLKMSLNLPTQCFPEGWVRDRTAALNGTTKHKDPIWAAALICPRWLGGEAVGGLGDGEMSTSYLNVCKCVFLRVFIAAAAWG